MRSWVFFAHLYFSGFSSKTSIKLFNEKKTKSFYFFKMYLKQNNFKMKNQTLPMDIWSTGKAISVSEKLPQGILNEAEVFSSPFRCWTPVLVPVHVAVAFLTAKPDIIIRVCELNGKILEEQEGRGEGKTENSYCPSRLISNVFSKKYSESRSNNILTLKATQEITRGHCSIHSYLQSLTDLSE